MELIVNARPSSLNLPCRLLLLVPSLHSFLIAPPFSWRWTRQLALTWHSPLSWRWTRRLALDWHKLHQVASCHIMLRRHMETPEHLVTQVFPTCARDHHLSRAPSAHGRFEFVSCHCRRRVMDVLNACHDIVDNVSWNFRMRVLDDASTARRHCMLCFPCRHSRLCGNAHAN